MSSYLAEALYGKDKVRVFRVVREGTTHHVVEYSVQVLVEGDMETRRATISFSSFPDVFEGGDSYTQADNSVVVATDSMKNITYCKRKCVNL